MSADGVLGTVFGGDRRTCRGRGTPDASIVLDRARHRAGPASRRSWARPQARSWSRGSQRREIVGMTTLIAYRIPTGLHAVIEDVVVDESARGHGVGAALVAEAARWT